MALYAIGDLHLHFGSVLKARAQLYDPLWKNHEKRLMENCQNLIAESDTLLLLGDHSWGRNLKECEKDFDYIRKLPGKKILTRGNHDMFWDAGKTKMLNSLFQPELTFLQDGYERYGDYALIASKGFTFEGPFYLDRKGRIIGWDEDKKEHADKLIEREIRRLRTSFEKAKADKYEHFILFLHYPPTSILEKESAFTQLAEEYGVEKVVYAHCHGSSRFHDSIEGYFRGIHYELASGDYLNWVPIKVLDQDSF